VVGAKAHLIGCKMQTTCGCGGCTPPLNTRHKQQEEMACIAHTHQMWNVNNRCWPHPHQQASLPTSPILQSCWHGPSPTIPRPCLESSTDLPPMSALGSLSHWIHHQQWAQVRSSCVEEVSICNCERQIILLTISCLCSSPTWTDPASSQTSNEHSF